jgi:hypothetical protein
MAAQRSLAPGLVALLLACESVADPPVATFTVSDRTLPTALRNSEYVTDLTSAVSGGVADHTWHLSQGSLPPGLGLTESGIVSGKPIENGRFVFDATVTSGASGPKTGEM